MLKSPTKPVGGSAALLAACRAGSIQTVDLLVAQATHALAKAATPGDVRRIALTLNASEPSGWTPLLYAARHGWSNIAQQLLAATAHIPVNNARLQSSGNTALHIASIHGHLDIVKQIIQTLKEQQAQLKTLRASQTQIPSNTAAAAGSSPLSSPNSKTPNGRTSLTYITASSPTATAAAAAHESSKDGRDQGSTVSPAVQQQQQQQSPRVMTASRIPQSPRSPPTPAAAAAAMQSPTAAASNLKGSSSSSSSVVAGVDVRNSNGDTPLMFAMSSGHVGVAAALLAAGATAAAANAVGITPLLAAAGHDQEHCLQLLKRYVGDEQWHQLTAARDAHGRTVLHFAAAAGHSSIVGLLLSPPAAADVWCISDVGRTALQEAEQSEHTECARLIQEQMQGRASAAEAAAAALMQEEDQQAAAGQQQQQPQQRMSRGGNTNAGRPEPISMPAAAGGGGGGVGLLSPTRQQKQQQQQQRSSAMPKSSQAATALSPTAQQQQQQQRHIVLKTPDLPASPAAAAAGVTSPSRIPGPPAEDRSGPAAAAAAAAVGSSSSSSRDAVQSDIININGWTAVVSGRKGKKGSRSGREPAAAATAAEQVTDRPQYRSAESPGNDADEQQRPQLPAVAAAAAAAAARVAPASNGDAAMVPNSHTYKHVLQQQQQQALEDKSPAPLTAAAAAAVPRWWDDALSEMFTAAPAAAALDIQLQHVLGVDVTELSMSQLDCLELIHRAALTRINDVRVQLANQQHAEEAREQEKLKQEIAQLVQKVKQRS